MLEWPEGFGLSVLFFGLLAFVALNFSKWKSVRFVALSLIVGLAFTHYIWIIPRGVSSSGLLIYDQSSLAFVQSFLGFILLTHLFCGSHSKLKPGAGGFQIAFSLFGTFLLVSNNMIIQILVLPIFFLMGLIAPQFTQRGQPLKSLGTALNWSLLLLVVVALSAGFVYIGSGSFQLNHLKPVDPVAYLVGWSLVSAILLILIFLFPIGLLVEDHFQSRDWFVLSTYRIGAILVFAGLFLKWSSLAPPAIPKETFEIIAIGFSMMVILSMLISKQILFVVQLLSLVPITFLFWAIVRPELLSLALPALFFVTVGIPRLLRSLILLKFEPHQTTLNLGEALRAASFWSRLEIFVIFLVLMPFGTFFGFNLLVKLPASAPICAALLTLALVTVLGRLLQVSNQVESDKRTLGKLESIVGIMSLVSLIVLGIYPTPLYNYINFLTTVP